MARSLLILGLCGVGFGICVACSESPTGVQDGATGQPVVAGATATAGTAVVAAAGSGGSGGVSKQPTITAGTMGAGRGGSGGSGQTPSSSDAAVGLADTGPTDAGTVPDQSSSAAAIAKLVEHLGVARDKRPDLQKQPFTTVALTRSDAAQAKKLLWDDFAKYVRESRASEVGATESSERTISVPGGLSMRYYLARRGEKPATGCSLFISMHGGGNTAASTNDSQWRNQISLVDGYNPKDAIWVAPRAPIDDWNMWFIKGIDELFERLITDMIVFEGIDPNKVYINGYSAGGDGVYQLGPRMGERWAGAGMSGGHPNNASPLGLRNVAFAIHVGGNDTSYDRNKKAEEWGKRLEQLAAEDPGGYVNQWQVHAGLPHWMELEDAVSIPFLQAHIRNPMPSKIVWEQAEITRSHFYWLAVSGANQASGTLIRASFSKGAVEIETATGVKELRLRFDDAMFDLDTPVKVSQGSRTLFSGNVPRTIATVALTLDENNDPEMLFTGEVTVKL